MNKKEELIRCFPQELEEDARLVVDRLDVKAGNILEQTYSVNVNGRRVVIPERVYFDEPASEGLSGVQGCIWDCIFTRHHNGFVRQKHLRKLLSCKEYWITPFCFRLLGEYVKDILSDMKVQTEGNIENYIRFMAENSRFYRKTKSRMISYWDCYYRREYPDIKSYIGFQIFSELEKAYHERMNGPDDGLAASC